MNSIVMDHDGMMTYTKLATQYPASLERLYREEGLQLKQRRKKKTPK